MDWWQILLGFILGFLASSLSAGGRRMLAPIVFRRKLHVGTISKDIYDGTNDAYWYIPIEVKASNWWKLVVGDIEVRATISYVEKDGSSKSHLTTWVEVIVAVPFVMLQIGGIERKAIIARNAHNQLLPLEGGTGKLFKDNQDITLKLTSGRTVLGRWRFPKAIVQDAMQEISPIKIKGKDEEAC